MKSYVQFREDSHLLIEIDVKLMKLNNINCRKTWNAADFKDRWSENFTLEYLKRFTKLDFLALSLRAKEMMLIIRERERERERDAVEHTHQVKPTRDVKR